MNVNKYPKLYIVLEEYYKNNPKEINNIGTFNYTPLMYATCSKEMVKFLLSCADNGANVNYRDALYNTALHCAAKQNHFESGKMLCEYGANVHIKDHNDMTPIDATIYYCYDDSNEFVQLLLDYDSNTISEKHKDFVDNISLLNTKN